MTTFDAKNVMSLMWDYWYEGMSQIYNGQKQFENLFLQSLSKQKEVWELLNDQVDFYSKNLQDEIVYYQTKTIDAFDKAQDESTKERIQQMQNQLNSVVEKLSKNAVTPQNILNQWIKGISQLEKIAEEVVKQQEKNRTEMKIMMDEYMQEVTSMMEKMNTTFEELRSKNLTLTK